MLKRQLTILVTLLGCLLTVSALAQQQSTQKSVFPKGCDPLSVTVSSDSVRLNAGLTENKQYLYLIKNVGRTQVELKRVDSNDFLDLGWTEQLRGQRWSAIAAFTPNYDITCGVNGRQEGEASCANALAICRYTYAQIPIASRGDYWVAQNLRWRPLVRAISRKGIRLRSGPRKARR